MKKIKDPLQILQIWFSSSFPVGSYAYSHGLEALIDDNKIKNKDDVREYLEALLFYGSLRNDYIFLKSIYICLLYTSPSPRDLSTSRMPSSA